MNLEDVIIDDGYDYIDHYDELLWPGVYRVPKRYIRDVSNPFEIEIHNFKKKYRFSQSSVFYIVSLLKPQLHRDENDNRGLPIAPEMALLLTLRFYATASFQIVCGELMSVSQPTASNIITRISGLLARLVHNYVKFPQGNEALKNRELFEAWGRHGNWPGLPGVDGAIDCTHIKIVSTPGCPHREVYRNRKSDFSINVQVVVGPQREILDIVARWAGSTHDSRIFQMSSVFMRYTRGLLTGRLVGDSGYPCLGFLLTPIRPEPEDPPSRRYNRAHVKTRNIVERTFGIWKRRFPCLRRGLANKLPTVSNIIVACAVLHNLSLMINDEMADEIEEHEVQDSDIGEQNVSMRNCESGFALRNTLIETLYS